MDICKISLTYLYQWNMQMQPSQELLWYLLYGMMYLGRISNMIYVCTWSHTLNNIQFLVSNMFREHGFLSHKLINITHWGGIGSLLPKFILVHTCVSPTPSSPVKQLDGPHQRVTGHISTHWYWLDVDVFMELPLLMKVVVNIVKWVLNLNKILYGIQQASADWFNLLKTGLERRGWHKSQVDPCVFYWKYSFILTYIDDCVIVSHKQETITLLTELLHNGPENYVFIDEGDISNYIGFKI